MTSPRVGGQRRKRERPRRRQECARAHPSGTMERPSGVTSRASSSTVSPSYPRCRTILRHCARGGRRRGPGGGIASVQVSPRSARGFSWRRFGQRRASGASARSTRAHDGRARLFLHRVAPAALEQPLLQQHLQPLALAGLPRMQGGRKNREGCSACAQDACVHTSTTFARSVSSTAPVGAAMRTPRRLSTMYA